MVPGNSADRSVGRDWITQCLSASERPPPSKMERSPPAPNTGAAFPPHDGARPRAVHLSANSAGCSGGGGGRGAEWNDPIAGRPHTALPRRFCPGSQAHPARSSEFADRWTARGRAPSWGGNAAPVLGAGGERSILLGGGRLEAERYWVIQSRPTDRSALFPGTVLCRRRSRRARAAVSDFHAAQRPPPFLNHRWWRWTLSLNAVPVWTCTRPVSFAAF